MPVPDGYLMVPHCCRDWQEDCDCWKRSATTLMTATGTADDITPVQEDEEN